MLRKRVKIQGYPKYTTDGVSVYRWNTKVHPKNGVYHLVPCGSISWDEVPIDVALGKEIEAPKLSESSQKELTEAIKPKRKKRTKKAE